MLSGKKGVAEKVVYDAFDIIKEKTGKDPMEVFETALKMLCQYRSSCSPCWWC